MSKTWNEDQLKAITTRNKNILVSASAGSGKTGVLIQRLVDLVTKDRIELNEILAMTFTNAAAAEMKKRLSSEITSLAEKATDEEEKAYLNAQLTQLTTAHISTIHSFCLSILQNYYYVLDCSLKRVTTILDTPTQLLYQRQAIDAVLKQQMQNVDQAFIELNMLLSARPESNDALADLILKTAEMASSQIDPDKWLNDAALNYQPAESINQLNPLIQQSFFDYLKAQVNTYLEHMENLRLMYELDYYDQEKKYASFLKKQVGIEALKSAMSQENYDAIRESIIAMAKLIIPATPNKEDLRYAESRSICQSIEDDLIAMPAEKELLYQLSQTYPLVVKLVECVKSYMQHYDLIKEEHDCIDFSDMEHMALAILQKNDGEVAARFKAQFKEIMVDEFQDSNDVQDKLVHLICQDNNVFRVGDVKQSIYGFRHALPSIMQGYKQLNDDKNTLIIFRKNYRSSDVIVRFNNLLYEKLMNVEGFRSLPFVEEDIVSIGGEWQKKCMKPIYFHALNDKAIQEELPYKQSKDDLKASYIANQLLKIKSEENYRYKDFVVLVRGNAKMDVLKKCFSELNIPFYMDSKHGFYSSNGIQIMLAALNSFINPYDDLNFAAMLTSPFFNYSSEKLAELRLTREENECFYQTMTRTDAASLETFEKLRLECSLSITYCINECFKWNNFYAECNVQDRTNLDYLFEKAVRFENEQGCSISGFLNSIEATKSESTAEASSISQDADVVRFMSIHQSKGLEFPVVFLWGSSSMMAMDNKEMVVCDSELGIGFKTMRFPERLVSASIPRIAIDHKKNREELEEEMRILYVATTRPKDQMHIVDFVKDVDVFSSGLSQSKIYARKGTTSWILGSLMNQFIPDLFRVIKVEQMWSNETQPVMIHEHKKLPVYHYNEQRLVLSSPSEKENTTFNLQPLSFTKKTSKSQIGSEYHKLIEELPDTEWTLELIKKIASKYKIDCSQNMLDSLMQLNENPIYRTLRKEECYHEYPFQYLKNNEIIHGFIDFVAIGEEITIVDFKTDQKSNASTLIRNYGPQINAYKEAMKSIYPNKKVKAYIYALTSHEMIQIS